MSDVVTKFEIGLLDGTPDKRLFWSIISDYDFKTAISELIDNSIDLWMKTPNRPGIRICLELDADRQLITLSDTAGGVRDMDLRLLIAPGGSNNSPDGDSIGVFGVGSKRAVVALAETITIKTRAPASRSFEVNITRDWLASPDWNIPHYEIPPIEEGTTLIELSALRKPLSEADIVDLCEHIAETYDWFLQIDNCEIVVNDKRIGGKNFEHWAYPPDYEPRMQSGEITLPGERPIGYEIVAGLIRDRDPVFDNYGVYFYCNNRLICKEVRVRELGYFVASEAGVPHPDASLCRVVVKLNGSAKLMPWNSSKTGINFGHPVFKALRPLVIPLVSYYSSLSRRLKDDWEGKVFAHTAGEIQQVDPTGSVPSKRLILPALPRVHKPKVEHLKAKNRSQIQDQPWTLGLVEAIAAVDIISRQRLQTRNRIALILLDSNFEIALKEFIAHRVDLFPNADLKTLFEKRHRVLDAVNRAITIPPNLLTRAKHYYGLRNKLIHERATVDITDYDVSNYCETVQQVLNTLFGLDF